jgi:hypothetical protein
MTKLTRVVAWRDGEYSENKVNLETSTVDREYGMNSRFCYYRESDERTVFAGLEGVKDDLITRVFVKLVDNDAVDLSLADWLSQWTSWPEFMKDEEEQEEQEQDEEEEEEE